MKFTHLLGMMMCVATLLSYHLNVVAQDSSVDYTQEESGLGAPLVAPTVDNIFLRLGPDVKYIPLPAFTGGKGQLTYTFSSTPSLPQGVSFDARGRRISYHDLNGNQNSPAKSYTYTATDEDGVSASATVSITVIDAYPVAPTVPELRLVMNQPIEPVTLPAFATTSDDNPTLSYNITGLPVGLDFNAGTRRLSGIPRYFRSANTWYEATDGVDIVRTPLTITVEEPDTQPVAPTQPQSLRFTAGVPVNSGNTLREFTSGNGVLTYSLRSSPRLPTGLSFNARTRRIVGTVPDNAGYDGVRTTTFTYTATDIDGDATSANFTIAVIDPAPSFSSRRIADIVATKNLPISRVRLPYAYSDSLGTGLKDYSITPSLPPRLTYNPDTRYLSGTPTVILPTTTYTYSAIGQDGDSASITFTITVEEDVDTRPVAPTQPQSLTFTVSPSTQSLALQAFTGGDGVLTYAMASTPRLPSWITFNPSTRLITVGRDNALDQNLPRRTFTYTATDEDGDTTSATFTLRVHDVMPSFGDRTIADVVTTQNSPITDVTLPAATPNPVNTYYSVSPSLPRGLTFSSSNRRLSGIPVVASPTTTYTYTARYSSGDSASLTFTITVEEEAAAPLVAPTQRQSITYLAGVQHEPKTLKAFTGGNGELTYAMVSRLPTGLSFNTRTRAIEGTIPDTSSDDSVPRATYAYSATDEDGDTARAYFTLSVYDDIPSFHNNSNPGLAIPNIVTAVNQRILRIVLPSARERPEQHPATYSLSPDLPKGLYWSSDVVGYEWRQLWGTPTEVLPTTTYTYTATHPSGDSDSVTFTITVLAEADIQPIPPSNQMNIRMIVQHDYPSDPLEEFQGGNGTLTYALTSDSNLPDWITFDPISRIIRVMNNDSIDQNIDSMVLTYTATDEDGDVASHPLTLDIYDQLHFFGESTISDITATRNSPITRVYLPKVQRQKSIRYSILRPPLPRGLSLTRDGYLVGTPLDVEPTTTYTYIAVNRNSIVGLLTFDITVETDAEASSKPVAPTRFQIPLFQLSDGEPTTITRTLHEFTGGNGRLTYAMSPTPRLPEWASFNPATRELSVTDIAGDQNLPRSTTFTYTATDEDGDTTSADFGLWVVDYFPIFQTTIANISATQNSPIRSKTLPWAYYGAGDKTYSLTPALPYGLTFNAGRRRLSGTPAIVSPTTTYTYTATDSVGDTVSLTFTITVEAEPDTRPVAPTQSQDLIFTAGVPVNSGNTLRAFTGGDGTLTYTLATTPSFPAGLSFNAGTRMIEGTVPDTLSDDSFGLTRYTYTATDEDGDTASATFTICVIDYVASFDGRSIANITATIDSPITSVTLPYAWSNSLYGGSQFSYPVLDNQRHSYFDYSLSPSLPQRLTYNPNYRVLSGTPTVASPTTTYTYTATEVASHGGGDSASLTFTITVEGEPDSRPVAPTEIQAMSWRIGGPTIVAQTLRVFTGGDGTLTYALVSTPSLPQWITFDPATRRITVWGDIAEDQNLPTTEYTYTATDEDGDTASATFTLTVQDYIPSFASRTIADIVATRNSPIASRTLPTVENIRETYEYSLTPTLPTGLNFSSSNRRLSGTPEVVTPTTTYTYTASDRAGDSDSLTFTITVVVAPSTPPVAPTQAQDLIFTAGVPVNSGNTLRAFTGGNGTLTYTLVTTPSFPAGLSFNTETRTIEGTVPDTSGDDSFGLTRYTYTATDEDGDTTSATFTICVIDYVASFDGRSIANITAELDSPITSVTLPYAWSKSLYAGSQFSYPVLDNQRRSYFDYSLSPSLPQGLTYNPNYRVLSGTPAVVSPTTTYTYTATEATSHGGGDSDSITFTITVEAVPSTPLIAPTQSQDLIFTAGVPVNSGNTLRAFTGGDGTLTYALVATPSFPAGLSFNTRTRTIEGTVPDTSGDDSFGLTRYTYTATDEDGDTTSATFTICVIDYVASFDGRSIANITMELDSPFTSVTLPYAWSNSLYGGSQFSYPVLDNQRRSYFDYSLSPSLPQGLTYNPNYRVLSGTPAVVSPTTTYTYTATEATSHGGGDSDSITFTITVEAVPSTPLIAPTQSQDLIFTAGVPVNSGNTLRAFTGGDGTLTYALASTPSLPDWITFNPSTRRITVGPDSAVDQNLPTTTYTYTATDADGDIASATFTITVQDYVPSFPASRTIADIVATQNSPIAIRTLPEVENIRGTYEYSLTPALPIGLYFYSSNRILSGTPIIDTPTTTYTYTASDRVGDTDSLTFTITVEAEPDFPPAPPTQRPPSGQNLYLVAGTQPTSSSRTLYPFAGGTGTLTYTLAPSPSLPPGLTFNARTRMIEGVIPDSAGDDSIRLTTYTYTATDENDNSASTVFHISVYDDIASFEDRTIANITAMQNSPIRSVVLPYAYKHTQYAGEFSYKTLDNQFLSMFEYSLSPSLPAELTFNPSSRRLSGTPTVGSPTTTYTYTATEAIRLGGGDSASLTFTITVEEELDSLPVAPVISNLVFTPGQVVNETLPPFTSVDNGVLTYSLTDGANAVTTLVGGLTYDPATRTISGTISGTPNDDSVVATNYTYSATDSDVTLPDTASVKFTITIVDDMPNFSGSSTIADITVLQNSAIASVTLPATIFGTGTLTYSLTPALPSGLEFSADDRVLFGTPVVGLTTTTYTYAVTDGDGDVDTLAFSITVIEDLQPAAPAGTVAYTFAVGQAVSTTLPAFTSGNGVLSYSLKPDLPSGLEFSADDRVLFGTPVNASQLTEYTYTATDEDGDSNSVVITLSVVPVVVEMPREIDTVVDTVPIAPPVLAFKFVPGQPVSETLPPFTGGNGILTYKLKATPALPSGLTFNANNRVLSGTLSANTAGDDSVPTTTYSYTATDEDGDTASASFSIEVLDLQLRAPVISDFTFTLDMPLNPITLPVFTSTLSTLLTYTLAPLPNGLTFNPATRVLVGIPVEEGRTTLTYTATDISGVSSVVTFIIDVMDVPPLEVATTNTLPSLGANIAQVATQAVSSRVELALNGQSQGVDIRTSEGQQFKFNAQNNGQSANSLARFGVWYSSSDDTLSSAGSALSWNGTTESTNVGLDVGFDLSSKASIVIGVMQNASSTSAIYNSGGESGELDIDLDSTTFYVGFGYDWLDVWFANGNADSTLSDSVRDGLIPTSFAYQTIGLTAAFDFTDGFEVGAKVESLNSALSLSSREALNYAGLKSDSSQFRTAFFVNYKLDLGREGNAQLIPKFEMGYRGLKQNTSAQGSAPAAGTAAETSFGLDYHHRLLNLTVGFDVRSFEVQDYTSESMQWHIRWESGAYDRGLSLQLKPHSIAESLGGVEALYTSDYSQYQSMLARQYGGDTQATNDEGLDFEMGYGIIAKTGTFTPFVKATNIGAPRGVDSGRRTEEVGLRYEASTGLDLGLKMEQSFRPESSSSSMARESIVTFTTRYNF